VLYDAGPKQVTFEDVDGDGFIEVDVAYSLEAGADFWLVDRYRWDGSRFVYSETRPRRPAALVPYDRYEEMLAAIEPLPDLEFVGKTRMIPQAIRVETQEIIEFDLDADGRPETLWTYRLDPIYKESTLAPVYELWLTILDADGRLLWQEPIQNIETLCSLSVSTTPVQLGPGSTGLLVHRMSQNNACRGGPLGRAILYGWREGRLVRLLDRMVSNSGAGRGASIFRESISLRDVDGDGWAEVLLSDRYKFFTMDGRTTVAYGRYPSYEFYWPGTLALRRDTDSSSCLPAYYMNGEQRTSIRSSWPIVFAPRLSQPLVVDGYQNDWWQVEYNVWDPLRIENDTVDLILRPSPLPAVSWDDQMLYLVTDRTGPGRTIIITLDTDLSGDSSDATLSEDDFVFVLTVPEPRPTDDEQRDVVPVRTLNSGGKQVDVQAVTVLSRARNQRILEIAIPLDQIGLNSAALVPIPGWVGGSAGGIGEREYHPRAGQAIGLAVDVSGWASSDAYLVDNPTTWNTLIFIADR